MESLDFERIAVMGFAFFDLINVHACDMLASSPPRAKNGEAPSTHCLRMRLISPRCRDSGLFSDSSVSCDVRVRIQYSKLVRIM